MNNPLKLRSPTFFEPASGSPYLVLFLALLPFITKAICFMFSVPGYLAQSSYKIFQIGVPILWRRRIDRKTLWQAIWPVDEPLPNWRLWLTAVGVAALLAGSAMLIIPLIAEFLVLDPAKLREQMDERFEMTPVIACFVVFYLFSFNAALEELHFRAWLDRQLSARWGNFAGVSISCTMFAAMHLFIFAGMDQISFLMLALVFISLSIAGAMWSWLTRQPGGIHAAWLSHGLTDAGLLTWGLFWLGYF